MISERVKDIIMEQDIDSLHTEVIDDLFTDIEEDDELITLLKNILEHGCVSGIVTSLVYYKDTNEFFNRHKEEINELFSNACFEFDTLPSKLIKNFDKEDILCLYDHNRCLLAWWAYENICFDLLNALEE